MNIRQVCESDLRNIAKVHIQCFPDSFSTQLGLSGSGYLMQRFYKEYMDDIPELFLVAEESNKIIGFCMGYYCEKNDYMKCFFRHNAIRIGARILKLLLEGNQQAKNRVKQFFAKESPTKTVNTEIEKNENDTGDLLSICVLETYRGKGVAQELMDAYLNRLKENGRKLCLLTVEGDNDRGICFYEKNGFVLYKENKELKKTYAKYI